MNEDLTTRLQKWERHISGLDSGSGEASLLRDVLAKLKDQKATLHSVALAARDQAKVYRADEAHYPYPASKAMDDFAEHIWTGMINDLDIVSEVR